MYVKKNEDKYNKDGTAQHSTPYNDNEMKNTKKTQIK